MGQRLLWSLTTRHVSEFGQWSFINALSFKRVRSYESFMGTDYANGFGIKVNCLGITSDADCSFAPGGSAGGAASLAF